MPDSDTTETTPTTGDESAQGTPGEPTSPGVGDIFVDEATERYGLVVAEQDGHPLVLWLGVPQRHELPLTKVG